jgi:hypothetical protein
MMACVVLILIDAVPRWIRYWNGGRKETREALEVPPAPAAPTVLEPAL